MIDPALILVDALNSDPDISNDLTGGIYAYRIPPEAVPPLALVLVPVTTPAAPPTVEWWESMATVDIHTETPQASLDVAQKVARLTPTVVGPRSGGVVADCQVASVSSVVDGGWTPTRYRQVVTVNLTAREP